MDEYKKSHMSSFVKSYFSNSFENMVSFFANEKSMTVDEMEDIMRMMEENIAKQKPKK